ncbi:MAG: hypothetical protein ABIF77_18040 [bacterium]
MQKRIPKLRLQRETLRILSTDDLAHALGGTGGKLPDTDIDDTVYFPDTLSPNIPTGGYTGCTCGTAPDGP